MEDNLQSVIDKKQSAFTSIDIPDYDIIVNCMHCGLCLPTCPTYELTGLERNSPRGRIRLIRAIADGELEITPIFAEEMYFCLACQACETACPAGIKYGSLVEAARAQIELHPPRVARTGKRKSVRSAMSRVIKTFMLRSVFTSNRRLKALGRLLRLYQTSGLQRLVRSTEILKLFSSQLYKLEPLAPPISKRFSDELLPEVIRAKGTAKHRVGFLTGCFMNLMYSDINLDTVAVLLHNDCEVIVPKKQKCCGALHAHNGDMVTARALARQNIDAFDPYDLDAIVMNSAGCGATMREYGRLLREDTHYAERAKRFSEKVKDVTEFLISIDFKKPAKPISKRVTYHEPCHLAHAQSITNPPREMLHSIPGLELVELNESTWCCGSAGIYNIIHNEESMRLLKRKMENIKNTNADILVTGNPGCLAQLRYGLQSEAINMELLHPVTLLLRAYGTSEANESTTHHTSTGSE